VSSPPAPPDDLGRGIAALREGRPADALACAEQRLGSRPAEPQAHRLRINAAAALGQWDAVIDSVQHLLAQSPGNASLTGVLATAHNNRGSRRAAGGDHAAALSDFEAAIAVAPDHPQAHFNAAVSLAALQHHQRAIAHADLHLQRAPDDAAAALLRVEWLLQVDSQAATDALGRLPPALSGDTSLAPRLAILHSQIGSVSGCLSALENVPEETRLAAGIDAAARFHQRGQMGAGDRLYAAALGWSREGRDAPGLRAQLGAALGLSPVLNDVEDIDAQRARFASGLDRLEAEWTSSFLASCEPRLEQLCWSNFFLAYHGRDDLALQARYAALLTRSVQALAPRFAEPPQAPVAGRIALISSFFRDSTVGAYFGGWVRWLAESGHAVHLYQLGPRRDALTDELAAHCAAFHFCDAGIDAIADRIRGDRPQLAIFPEFGMDARIPVLAAARMAPGQLAGWGHPVTSGMASIDGWFTCAGMEPPDGSAHYSEALLGLPGLGVDYRRPSLPPALARAALGLPDDRILVLVPQAPFKLHPGNDAVLAAIAEQRPGLRFVMFGGELPQWQGLLQQRLARAFAARGRDAAEMICWLPLTSRQRYLQVNRACDLMLDSLHWSGGNTTLDALHCGLPVVTVPGRFMRGRQSAWMLELAGVAPALVRTDPEQLVARVIELVDDDAHRRDLAAAITAGTDALFDADAARAAFLDHVARALCGGATGEP
jgi:tetratricopeptide (TPR) repeat protein